MNNFVRASVVGVICAMALTGTRSFGADGATGAIEGKVTIKSAVARDEMKAGTASPSDEYAGGAAAAGGGREGGSGEPETENVVVYISGDAGGGPYAAPKESPKMVQQDKRLEPHVLPILVGTTVDFPNMDDFNHNIFSLSTVKKFDLGLYKSGTSKQVTFDKPGQVKVYCNIHSQMRAIIQVLENPYFTKPGKDGSFRIDKVPAGAWELVGWHEKFPASIRQITVKAGETAKADFTFE